MIKVDIIRKKGSTSFVFETNTPTEDGLSDLDDLYCGLMNSAPKRGGYLDSNRFEVEVKDLGEDDA